jgi:hypothetical protein
VRAGIHQSAVFDPEHAVGDVCDALAMRPSAGRVWLAGAEVTALSERELPAVRLRSSCLPTAPDQAAMGDSPRAAAGCCGRWVTGTARRRPSDRAAQSRAAFVVGSIDVPMRQAAAERSRTTSVAVRSATAPRARAGCNGAK